MLPQGSRNPGWMYPTRSGCPEVSLAKSLSSRSMLGRVVAERRWADSGGKKVLSPEGGEFKTLAAACWFLLDPCQQKWWGRWCRVHAASKLSAKPRGKGWRCCSPVCKGRSSLETALTSQSGLVAFWAGDKWNAVGAGGLSRSYETLLLRPEPAEQWRCSPLTAVRELRRRLIQTHSGPGVFRDLGDKGVSSWVAESTAAGCAARAGEVTFRRALGQVARTIPASGQTQP